MYAPFTMGVALRLSYGINIGNMPIIFANIITFLLTFILLWLKIMELSAGTD
jgi:MtN3 and saliva related transmembrane protein